MRISSERNKICSKYNTSIVLEEILVTVSRESAPRAANFESPETAESSGRASCFFTISHTFFTVSGLAYTGALAILLLVYIVIWTLSLKYKCPNFIILKHKVLLNKTNVPIHNTETKQLIK